MIERIDNMQILLHFDENIEIEAIRKLSKNKYKTVIDEIRSKLVCTQSLIADELNIKKEREEYKTQILTLNEATITEIIINANL